MSHKGLGICSADRLQVRLPHVVGLVSLFDTVPGVYGDLYGRTIADVGVRDFKGERVSPAGTEVADFLGLHDPAADGHGDIEGATERLDCATSFWALPLTVCPGSAKSQSLSSNGTRIESELLGQPALAAFQIVELSIELSVEGRLFPAGDLGACGHPERQDLVTRQQRFATAKVPQIQIQPFAKNWVVGDRSEDQQCRLEKWREKSDEF